MYINIRNTGIWPRFSHGLFWLVALLNIWAINAQNGIVDLITKPLLIPLLLLYYITASLIGINRFFLKSDFLHGVETLLYAPTLYFIFLYFKTKTNHEF